MKLPTIPKPASSYPLHWLTACLVLTACGGGNGDGLPGDQSLAYGVDARRFALTGPCDDRSLGSTAPGRSKRCSISTVVAVTQDAQPIVSTGSDSSLLDTTSAVDTVAAAPTPTPVTAAAPSPAPAHGGIEVDTTNLPVPQPGVSTVMLSAPGAIPPPPAPSDWEAGGAFRLLCNWSKMSFDDPIVYPGQPGAAHHHTFFGNTAIDAYTTPENIRSKGNSSCRGGTINLSGYWVPSMIDTSNNRPIAPKALLIYYKTGLWPYMNDGSVMQPIPKGLRMIAGEPSRTTAGGKGSFVCLTIATGSNRGGTSQSIPTNCVPGADDMRMEIPFPQCWDGVNLDSPDHKSHMSYPIQFWTGDPNRQYRCPASHPVVLPEITFIVEYNVPATAAAMGKWRLASDSYDASLPGGYSRHGDWMNGWDPAISDLWGVKCLRERRDCGSANLGDGRQTLEFQGN